MSWQQIKLSNLFDVGSAKRVLKAQWQTEGVPFYRGREVTKLSKHGHVDNELFISEELYKEYKEKYGVPSKGDIVITAIGTIGNSYIVQERDKFYYKDASVLCLKKIADVDSQFIDYWLKSSDMRCQLDEGNGATVDTLTITKMKNLKINLPPLSEQEEIVAILDKAFAGIDKAIENTEKNLASTQELFDSYLNNIFTQKDEGWEKRSLKDVFELVYGKPLAKEDRSVDGKYPAYGANGVKCYTNKYYHDKKTMIIGRKGSAGEITLTEDKFWPLDVTYFVSFNDNEYDLLYLYKVLKSLNLQKLAKGVKPGINRNDVYALDVYFPSLKVQKNLIKKIVALEEQLNKLKDTYEQKLNSLNELKQSLLQKAFRGELTSNDISIAQEAAE